MIREQIAHFERAARVEDVERNGCMAVSVKGHVVALFAHQGQIYAVENRCPHMGFPLDRGSVADGILTCHWHHARFDLESGGTFDQWADDVRRFPVEVRDGDVWIDTVAAGDAAAHQRQRLRVGLERDIPLVIAKAVLFLLEENGDGVEPFRSGLAFGTSYRRAGWGQGLTILTCLMNMVPALEPGDRSLALYQGLSAVASETFREAPRFGVRPLPDTGADLETLKRWFRRFIEVRDAEGAERCIISAIQAGADDREMADILFAAVTDHRYIQGGHVADFTNKAFEALDVAGWELAEPVLTSLVDNYANASRREESNAWRNPIDLVALLEEAFERLPSVADATGTWAGRAALVETVLGDDAAASIEALLDALAAGATPVEVASAVSYAAALRLARFHTSNEFGDWDTALHTFSFANAIEQGLRRAPSLELLRGVFDAAMSVYLDRFLNIPAARVPLAEDEGNGDLSTLPALLDRQQQVNQAGRLVAAHLYDGGDGAELLALLGRLLLREDRDFHTIQTVEAAFKQYSLLHEAEPEAAVHVLVAAARYLAAHAPTVRAQGQTYQIARRLHRGDQLHTE